MAETRTPAEASTAYAGWLARQPLAANTRRTYRVRVAQYCAYLATTPVDAGDPLRDRSAASYAARDYRTWLKTVRKAKPASVNLSLAALDHFYRFLGLDPPDVAREDRRAVAEYGRIAKSLFMLSYYDDHVHRRRVLHQINRQEGRHRFARALCYGQKGELRQHYKEGQEDQLAALGLVLNVAILWNTRYMQRTLDTLRVEGVEVRPEDIARLSPLGFDHITILGRYQFVVPESVQRGEFRPLRPSTGRGEAEDYRA